MDARGRYSNAVRTLFGVVMLVAPPRILKKLPQDIEPGRHVYICDQRALAPFLRPPRALYKVHLMEDFSHLWSNTSRWYRLEPRAAQGRGLLRRPNAGQHNYSTVQYS